ncbi:MAG TPA: glutathionylspermidine synthase family protein [Thermodesulfovibrionales bacterium]|nr:glutathionylspermidine synthase family protein [Thermodesulfovibrionales bacterium]
MRRLRTHKRPDWTARCEEIGFCYHTTEEGIYWDESGCYEFTSEEIDVLDNATAELYHLCLSAVDRVIADNLFPRLAIPVAFAELAKRSWERRDTTLYGRFDLCYDGKGKPRLLEFNADTPTSLFESSIVQWVWLQDLHPSMDQFNSIHEKLANVFSRVKSVPFSSSIFHFSCVRDNAEDFVTTEYMRDVAAQQGFDTRHIFIEDIGWSDDALKFANMQDQPIDMLFKLYPWEWLIAEEFGKNLLMETVRVFEPPWKMILSNKGILPILWEMYPGHPNLLPAYFGPGKVDRYVRKPLLSREGANVTLYDGLRTETMEGEYGEEGYIYQQYCPIPAFDGNHAVIGSWVINGETAGIGVREDTTRITTNTSRFVPHYFAP